MKDWAGLFFDEHRAGRRWEEFTFDERRELLDLLRDNLQSILALLWEVHDKKPRADWQDRMAGAVAPLKTWDDFDFETMEETSKIHSAHFVEFLKRLRKEHPELDVLPLGAGECMNCQKCTFPDSPCRFPELMSSPMEGYGMVISDVCKDNNILYNHGRGTLTYVGCYLFREVSK